MILRSVNASSFSIAKFHLVVISLRSANASSFLIAKPHLHEYNLDNEDDDGNDKVSSEDEYDGDNGLRGEDCESDDQNNSNENGDDENDDNEYLGDEEN